MRFGQMREQKHYQDDRQHKWTDGLAAVNRLQAQIRGCQQPGKERKRTEKIVIRHGMYLPGPVQQRKVMKSQAANQTNGRSDPGWTRGIAEIPDIERETSRVKKERREYVKVYHFPAELELAKANFLATAHRARTHRFNSNEKQFFVSFLCSFCSPRPLY